MQFESSGSFDNIERWLKRVVKGDISEVESFANKLVNRLKKLTPVSSGLTAESWSYKINKVSGGYEIVIINTNNNNGVNVARLLHYGHGTGTGGWVPGTHYITTAVSEAYSDSIKTILESMTK